MQARLTRILAGVAALLAVGLLAAGCGGDESTTGSTTSTTSTTAEQDAEQAVDSAVQSCTEAAQGLGGTVGTAVYLVWAYSLVWGQRD